MTSLVRFFVLTLGITFAAQLPAVLAKLGVLPGPIETYAPLAGLGALGPLLAALWLSRRRAGGEGVGRLFRKKGRGSIGLGWYPLALLLFPGLYVASAAVARVGGVDIPWFFPPENAQHVVGLLLMPIAEEPGWRGFALVRLEKRLAPVVAALVLGAIWAVWHTAMFILQDIAMFFPHMALQLVAGSVLFSWVYRRTEGSLWCAVLVHAGAHLCNPLHAVPGSMLPFLLYTGVICVGAILVVALDREIWRRPAF